jgi:hypothetical protein
MSCNLVPESTCISLLLRKEHVFQETGGTVHKPYTTMDFQFIFVFFRSRFMNLRIRIYNHYTTDAFFRILLTFWYQVQSVLHISIRVH